MVLPWVCSKTSDLFEEGLPGDIVVILLGPHEPLGEDFSSQKPPACTFPEEKSQLISAFAAEDKDRTTERSIGIGSDSTSGEHVNSPSEIGTACPYEEPSVFQGMDERPI